MDVNRGKETTQTHEVNSESSYESERYAVNSSADEDEAATDYEVTANIIVNVFIEAIETNDINGRRKMPRTNETFTSMMSAVGRYNVPVNVVPTAPEGVLPVVGTVFPSIGHCIDMYDKYAEYCGFDIRLATEKKFPDQTTKLKYLLCHKAGLPNKRSINSTKDPKNRKAIRNSNFKVTGCDAQVRFRKVAGSNCYKLYYFDDTHNHLMYDEHERILSRNRRQIRFSDKRFIHHAARANLGAAKAHQLQVCLKGGYEEVGCTRTDYKNFKRDFDTFIGDGDVQMVINMFNERVEIGTNFAYEYKVSNGKLEGLFWADELMRFNYTEFGHVISFDATYKSNKHCFVYIPFLAIDNNKHTVVVGSGILCDEKLPSYTWLLESFLKVHRVQPKLVLTDQDAAIREALPIVFNESRHRLCMWHIMGKLPTRICRDTLANTNFRDRLLKLIWSVYLGPQEFETKWNDLMNEFNFVDEPWLSDVYRMRSKWIPGFFQDLPMCGLMKTTSRSESLNSFFKSFAHYGNDLLMFILNHDTAMDRQRHIQRTEEHSTNTTVPAFKTNRNIECHATMLYTRAVFFEVQKEIVKGDRYCSQWNVVDEEGKQVFTIRQKDKTYRTKAEFKVSYQEECGSVACSCQRYEYFGTLCCHIFSVLFNLDVEEIPTQYVNRRWMRGVIPMDVLRTRRIQPGSNDESEKLTNDIQFEFDQIMNRIYGDEVKLSLFLEKVRSIKAEVSPDIPGENLIKNKDADFERLLGVSKPVTIEIRAPGGIRNKCCGIGKRLKSRGERAAENARPKRKCRGCNELVNHDIRNCPSKKATTEESDD